MGRSEDMYCLSVVLILVGYLFLAPHGILLVPLFCLHLDAWCNVLYYSDNHE